MKVEGFVYLVGAGPGDPALLTLRAANLLATADVVAYDALVSAEILALIPVEVQRVPVGHRGRSLAAAAPRLHPAVLAHAQAGHTVVRLKGGDPFVFGRGGEEAEELAAAGIPYEIVPGISAALGAAASARIPLTHRGVSSSVTFASGQDADGRAADFSRLAGSGTLVLYMATHQLGAKLARLIEHGRPPGTPAAYVAAASTSRQEVVIGTLGDLEHKLAHVDPRAPALIIVGEVVRLRRRLAQAPVVARRSPAAVGSEQGRIDALVRKALEAVGQARA
jgi:uroporphyrinogen III methyltransferase/synthase